MTKSKWIAVALAAVIAGGAAVDAFAGDGARAGKLRGRHGAAREKFGKAMKQRRQRVVQFLATLEITDEQRRLVLEKARAAAPLIETAKGDARRIIAQAWAAAAKDAAIDRKALKETTKAQLVALREKTRAAIEPLAKEVVASLTPEQRKKVEEAAAKHGRTVDDAKLTKFAAHMISRPMTIAFLEARLGR
jgi:hypothetical protein